VAHRILGPPLACIAALADALREGRSEFRRSYRSIRSWHADVIAKEDKGR
jgi:hypothetical protein